MINLSEALEFRVTDALRQSAAGMSVLVVEDQLLIAIDLENMLLELGAKQVIIAHTADKALELIAITVFDIALLDLRLGDSTSRAVAVALRESKIPFALTTGYYAPAAIHEEFLNVPVIAKPYQEQDVASVLLVLVPRQTAMDQ